jgi:hypothetical protein
LRAEISPARVGIMRYRAHHIATHRARTPRQVIGDRERSVPILRPYPKQAARRGRANGIVDDPKR